MRLPLVEVFGHHVTDMSPVARKHRSQRWCPVLGQECAKRGRDTIPFGTCSMEYNGDQIVICPERFYFDDFEVLRRVAQHYFGSLANVRFYDEIEPSDMLPVKLDWVLAKVVNNQVEDFCVVEIQSIDTSGTVRPVYDAFLRGADTNIKVNYSPNWANVFKRLLPQVISKGRMCHDLGKRLYVVTQDHVLNYALNRMPLESMRNPRFSNIIFVPLTLKDTVRTDGFLEMGFSEFIYTTSEDVEKAFVKATRVEEETMHDALIERQRKLDEEAQKRVRATVKGTRATGTKSRKYRQPNL